MKRIMLVALSCLALGLAATAAADVKPPVRLAIVGLAHDHVRGFLPALAGRTDVVLVGLVDADASLRDDIANRFHLERKLFHATFADLRAATPFDAVAIFSSTFDHRKIVEECADAKVAVMMEKPLAVSATDARAIAAAAQRSGVPVIVNYETTWYPSVHAAFARVAAGDIGETHKIVVHDGHSGPARICSNYFLAWLTDPVLDGGGALMDFGCYGADLVTVLLGGRRPDAVFAVTQHFQPDVYPKVDDEATIVLTYPHAQAILQASWNWPAGRKDMEIYGAKGSFRLPDGKTAFERDGDAPEKSLLTPALVAPETDSISYLAAVARHEIAPSGFSALETNVIVCEILDAAKESARTGRRIDLSPAHPQSP
ncbi:MAG TPA: Gfo/Idh/MocA family oxidoreductase [Candidatus Didemnitutus sp.]|nr:Gfo/Idh/MocA family oxidoreductase [Candidatus Didemnitutus sp.]